MGRGQSFKTVNSTLRNTELNSVGDKPSLIKDGVKSWHKNGLLHRDNDQPAVINPNGELSWYVEGKLHREDDKPALVKPYDR